MGDKFVDKLLMFQQDKCSVSVGDQGRSQGSINLRQPWTFPHRIGIAFHVRLSVCLRCVCVCVCVCVYVCAGSSQSFFTMFFRVRCSTWRNFWGLRSCFYLHEWQMMRGGLALVASWMLWPASMTPCLGVFWVSLDGWGFVLHFWWNATSSLFHGHFFTYMWLGSKLRWIAVRGHWCHCETNTLKVGTQRCVANCWSFNGSFTRKKTNTY